MKPTKLILFAVIIFFGVILTDVYSKPLINKNEDSQHPRRRVVYVKQHCYVRPVVYVTPKHHYRKHHRRIIIIR